MEFYTSFSQKRPVRLCEHTRRFAYQSLYEHKYGLDTKSTMFVQMDDTENFAQMSAIDKYDAMIQKIVSSAPIRICEGEKISGAATLGNGIYHLVPATYNGNNIFYSVSHLTIDFQKVLDIGVNGIRQQVMGSLLKADDENKIRFLKSCLHCISCLEIWKDRYIRALEEAGGYSENIKNLQNVPMNPPTSFYEAVQSIWFVFAFTRLCGNWPGIGRIDKMLGRYLENDLEKGVITIDQAREILAHFFIKGCEWVTGENCGSGDAQHYQNIVLGGIDENGNEVANAVTDLVLDIVEETGISDFPVTVRINKNTDKKLIERVAEVMRYGNGVIAVYNEDLILRSLTDYGYAEKEAVNFANDGCWEVQIPGKTCFTYIPFDALAVLQNVTLNKYENTSSFDTFEQLYKQYIADIGKQVSYIFEHGKNLLEEKDGKLVWKKSTPCTVISLFEEGCIEKGISYLEGGALYNVISPHIGGTADAANSLYAIKKLVFDEKTVNFDSFMQILKNNWEGNEALRQHALTAYKYYGNDNDEVDSIASRILSDFADICRQTDGKLPIMFPPGVSTFGRQIEWAANRCACAHGRKQSEILAGNLSPTPGTDTLGATAVIRSYCKADLSKQTTGAALDIRLLPNDVKGEKGIKTISALIQGFVALGGYFMQIDVADGEILKDAQSHPENYPALAVRISGWNARFVTLSKEWQDMVISNITGETKKCL